MSESICRILGNKFRIPINNSIINQLYQTLTKGAQSNELPSLFSAAISSTLGENILQTQGLLNKSLDSIITQTIEGILQGLGQALNINIDIKKALDLAAQVKVDAGVGLNANTGAAVGADIGAALGADVGVGLGSDVGLGLDANVGLDANANNEASANAGISTNLGLGFSPSADVGLGVGFNAPNTGLKLKNLLGLKLKATGVLDILASKKPSKSDIANISKLICRFLANKFQIQLNASMIKLLYGSLIKLNARARPEDFGNVLAAVIINILQSQGLLNVNLNTLLTQATECTLLGLSQALNINIDIKKALNLAGQVKVDIGIGANTDISGSLRADAEVGVGADVPVGLGTDVDTRFEADVGIGLDASLGTGANADLNANLGLGLLQSADKGLGVGLNIPNFGLKLTNLLALKLKATGVFNVLAKKTPSQSDFLNISKLISRLLANKFQIQLNASLVKLFYGSLIKLNGRAKPEDFANVLAASTMNILQSQGLLKINPDSLLTQATECILQGFAKALDINIDIKNALDLATQVQVDIGVGVDADTGAGLNTDIGIGLGADVGIGLGGDVSFGIGAGIGAGLGASVGVDTNLGLDLSPSTGIGQQTGLNVPNLGLKLTNLLGLKLKATGMLNILATKTPSRSHIVNISKSVSKLLATKFQIQFNGSMIKLFYNSLAKLDATRKPDDFANVLAAVTINILQSQGLLNINLDSLLSQATECILLGLREALNINVDIKKALDLAAQVKVDVGADVGLAGNVAIGVGADAGVDANTNLGIQEGPNIDASANADVNTNLGLGLSPSTGMRLGVGLNVPDLGLKLKNLLVLKLKAAGVLNILATKAPSRSDIVNISKSICRLLANKFQIKLDVSMIKLLYGSLAKFDATAKPDDFANVLAAVTMNILQSQGLLNINLDTLLTQATECILLGLGQALNIDIDIKSALDLAAKMKVDAGAGVDVDVGVGLGADIEAGVGLGAKAGIGLDAGVGIDADANLGIQVGADVDTSADVNANLGVGLKPSPDVRLGVGINVPDISLKLKNLLSLKLKATGALNVLETKRLSRSDIMNISKLICRLLANKFQVQFNVSTIKVLYGSLIKLNAKAMPDDFANVLATVTINILQSQGLLDTNLDTVLTQAIECILLGLGKALNINIDIKKALDLAAQVKVDISADVNADAEVSANVGLGLGTNIGLGVGADTGTDLDASGGVDANANLDVQAGAKVDADVNAYLNSDLGLGLSPSTGVGLGVGANAPALGVKLGNLLALKLKATGALNILATKRPSRSDIVNISKSICRLLVNKFQIKLNVSMIKLLYGSLAKLGATAKADDFADVLAAVTMNILQSQGLLNINLDSLLTQATECILLGLGQALNINIDIQNALGLAAKIKVDAAIGVDADVGVGLGADVGVDLSADVGVGADAGIGIDANVGVDANTNLGILAGADIDTSTNADINANLGVGLSSSADVGLGVGMKVPDLGLKLKNLLALKLKATGVLNILGTRKPSKSDIVNISKLICRLLANKFQIQLNVPTIKLLYGSLIKVNARATPEDFANVLATVTINILQSQGLLDINLNTLLTQATECILLGLGQALNINLDIKKALDLAAKVDIGVDLNADAGVSADVGLGLGADIGLGVGADTGVSLDANLGAQAGAKVDVDINTDINADLGSGLSSSTEQGLGVGVNVPDISLKLKNLLALKLKATGVLNILATKTPSRSDIVNISKSICRLLANKFQIKLNVSMIKLLYSSLAKLDATAKPDDFANVLATVTSNILQSQGLLNISLDSLLTQATECILLGLGQTLNINVDIKNALDLAAKVDAGVAVDASVGVGLDADVEAGLGLGTDIGIGLGVGAEAGIGANAGLGIGTEIDANENLGVQAGANLGLGLSPSADIGLGIGLDIPNLILKLRNTLSLKLKATGVLNILATKTLSKTDFVNISKSICRLLANKFQIQLNASMIKLFYGSLIKLNGRAKPDDFANVLAAVTMNILQSQGLLNINIDPLLTQATECILLGFGQALNISVDIKNALDLAAQVKVDVGVGVEANTGASIEANVGAAADLGTGLDVGLDANTNLDVQARAKVDADVNANLGLGISPSVDVLGAGLKVPGLSLKLKNLLALKLKATGVLNILVQNQPSKSDIVNISKSISRLLANRFQIQLTTSMIKQLYGSFIKLNSRGKADDFANVLSTVTMNILQSQGLLNISLDTLLNQATECIILGLKQALNINVDVKKALDLAVQVKADIDVGVDADVGVGADVGVDLDSGTGVDISAGIDVNAGANVDVGVNADVSTNLGLDVSPSVDVEVEAGLNIPNLGLKLRNILTQKLKATGVLNVLTTKTSSKSDIVNISKLICRLLANKFQIQLNASMIKLFYGSLIKLNGRAKPDDFAAVLATVTMNILQSQGLLNKNLDLLLTQATECILLGLKQALNINVDIKTAADLAAQVKLDVGADIDADLGVGFTTDAGVGIGADLGIGLDAGVGVNASANLGVQAGADVSADANADVNANIGLSLSSSTNEGLGVGLNVPKLGLKLRNLLALKLKATGVLNILATNRPSKTDIINISKQISRLLANKFQIQLNASMIKLLYNSLIKLNDRGKPDDFGNILAAGTVSILESQGLLNINLDSLLTPILECILRGLGQALRINIDIKKALDLAAQLKTDVGVDLDADPGIGLGTDLGITTDTRLGLDADVNANVGAQAGVNVDAGIDINANLDLGLSPSANVGLGAGLNSPNLSLKLRNLLALKLKATGVLNVLATRRLSKSDTVNISKLICRLLAKKFQIQLNASRVKLLYGSLIKLNARAKPDDFANVLSAVIMNILQSQGLLRNNLNSLLTQATECILLGLGRALNINIDIKKALDLSAQVKVDVEVGVDTDVGIGADTKVGVDVDTNVGLDLDANVGVGLDTDVGLGTDIGLGLDAGVGIDATANLGVQAAADISADTGVGVNVDSKLLNVDAKVKADVKAEAAEQLADALKSSEEFKLAILMGQEETVLSAIGNVINDIFGRKAGISFLSKFNMSFD
ncbi:hypothetical protein X975_10658, partial [Stegodyphus mimosarum]